METTVALGPSWDALVFAPLADASRLRALDATRLLDTAPSPTFEDIARRAAHALGTPSALVSLVDGTRQYHAGAVGVPEPFKSCRQLPLSHSMCRYVVCARSPLVVSDARQNEEFRTHGAVIDLGIVAYLGVPLVTAGGLALGSCCVADVVPRQWTGLDLMKLATLGVEAVREIERMLAEQTVPDWPY